MHFDERVVPGTFVAGAGGFPSDVPLVATGGQGPYIEMESGDEYLDYLLGGGPLIHGHAHPEIVAAVQSQAAAGTTTYLNNRVGLDLADRIVEAVPCAEQLKFTSSGSEATYFALRLARAKTGNQKVLKFEGAYHGFHDYAMRSSNYADQGTLRTATPPDGTIDSAGVVKAAAESVLTAPYNDLEMTREIVTDHADELAAIIVEPHMRSLPPVEGFLAGLRDLADDTGQVLIFDEVVTGFRMAWGGGQEFYGVTPDLATLGKAIGGGTPVGAVCGRRDIMTLSHPDRPAVEGGAYVSGTLNGNPLCTAAGHASLDLLAESGAYAHLNDYAQNFRDMIDDVLADASLDGFAIGHGPIVDYLISDGVSATAWADIQDADAETKKEIDRALLDRGVLQPHGGKRYISTVHGDAEFDLTEEAFKSAVEAVA